MRTAVRRAAGRGGAPSRGWLRRGAVAAERRGSDPGARDTMPGVPVAYELLRVPTRDAGDTTVYVTRHPLARTRLRVVCFPEGTRLDHRCASHGQPEAIVAGFFLREPDRPLGEVVIDG